MKNRKLVAVLKSFVIFFIIYFMLSFTVIMLIYEGLFARTEEYEYSLFVSGDELGRLYTVSDADFESRGFILNAGIYGENKDKLVILGHAKGSSSDDMLPEAKFFLENGFSVMTLDFTGHSASGGNSQYGLQQPVYDMENAISHAKKHGYNDIYLYGIGIGGYAAAACADVEGVKGVAAISAFSSISDMTLEYLTENMSIFGYIEYPVAMLYQYIVYGSDIGKSAVDGINNSDVPVIIINGTADEEVRYDGAALIADAEKIKNPDVIYRTVEGGVHLSVMRSDSARNLINEFNERAYALYNEFGGEVPVVDIETLYDSYDSEVASSLDATLMSEVLAVFNT